MAQVAPYAIVVGIGILASVLAKKKEKGPDAPPLNTSSSRGFPSSYVVGPRPVKPVVSWVGGRFTRAEKLNGAGKGIGSGPGTDSTIFFEEGSHLLAVNTGRPRSIQKILQNGEIIAQGPFTPLTNPSGSRLTLPNGEGTLEFRWGFPSDPVDAWAGDPKRIGILSKFPGAVRINWIEKRLGPSAVWPGLEYVLEMEPVDPTGVLNPADAWISGGLVNLGSEDILAVFTPATSVNGSSMFVLKGHVTDIPLYFQNKLQIKGNLAIGEDALFTILSVWFTTASEVHQDPLNTSKIPVTVVSVIEPPSTTLPFFTTGAGLFQTFGSYPGKASVRVEGDSGGANLAHAISQILFDSYPKGLGLPSSSFDMSSLVALSDLILQEGYKGSAIVEEGGSFESLLNAMLTDLGCMVVQDSGSGLLTYRPIRPGKLTEWLVPGSAVQGRAAEIRRPVSPSRPARLTFLFQDQALNYEDRPISVNDDGLAFDGRFASVDPLQIETTVDFDSASRVALRREQEYFSGASVGDVKVGFNGRRIRPGDVVIFSDTFEKFLVVQSTIPENDTGAVLDLVSNPYAAPPSPLQALPQGAPGAPSQSTPLVAAQARLLDLPDGLKQTALPAAAALLWVRSTAGETQSVVSGSADGLTYQTLAAEPRYVPGGTLVEPISAVKTSTGLAYISGEILEENPLVSLLGPDTGLIQDLSGAPETYNAGQQLLLIENEVCFLEHVVLTSPSSGRLVKIKRGMFGTAVSAHPAGAEFYILRPLNWKEIVVPGLIEPGTTIFYKVQTVGIGTPQDIGLVTPKQTTFAP